MVLFSNENLEGVFKRKFSWILFSKKWSPMGDRDRSWANTKADWGRLVYEKNELSQRSSARDKGVLWLQIRNRFAQNPSKTNRTRSETAKNIQNTRQTPETISSTVKVGSNAMRTVPMSTGNLTKQLNRLSGLSIDLVRMVRFGEGFRSLEPPRPS